MRVLIAEDDSAIAAAIAAALRSQGHAVDCVVDGDTIWVGGEKIRLSGVDAPEIAGTCGYERDLAQRAKSRLSELLSKTPFLISRSGIDRYGRTLAAINLERGGTAGSVLVREGLARAWVGRRIPWC